MGHGIGQVWPATHFAPGTAGIDFVVVGIRILVSILVPGFL